MIGKLIGTLDFKSPPTLGINVNGLTYEVDVSMNTLYKLPKIGQEVVLHTHLLVREDAQLLFGFYGKLEKEMFRVLIKVNGVGARTALAILSGFSVQELAETISSGDPAVLTKVPGIGKKTADRMFLELKDRIGFVEKMGDAKKDQTSIRADVSGALSALGYAEKEIASVLNRVNMQKTLSEGIKAALFFLANTR